MKDSTKSDEEKLLNAALGDEDWAALSGSLKRRSLQSYRRTRVLRRSYRAGMAGACLLALAMGAWRAEHPSGGAPGLSASRSTNDAAAPAASAPAVSGPAIRIREISEEEMLALFPKGSCAIADLKGKKTLVFLNPEEAARGFPLARQ